MAAAKENYIGTTNATTRAKVLARLLYSDQMQLLDKKIKHFESARKTSEMNAQFIYDKMYAGRQAGKGETLGELMNQILNEKISGKKAEAVQDSRLPLRS